MGPLFMLFVLVHGAFQSSWCWDGVRHALLSRGHRVLTPRWLGTVDEPLAPGEAAVDVAGTRVVEAVASAHDHDVVLVGHSGGGPVVQYAADRLGDRVVRVVFVAAVVLHDGESFADLFRTDDADGSPEIDEAGSTAPPSPSEWASTFVNGASPQLVAETAARLVPTPAVAADRPVSLPRFWRAEPRSSYVFLRDDRVAPDFWPAMAARLTDPSRHECDGPHEAMLTHPEQLAAVLVEAAT